VVNCGRVVCATLAGCTLQHEWMFGEHSGLDVTDAPADVMLPVTSVDRLMLQQAENIGNCRHLLLTISHLSTSLLQ